MTASFPRCAWRTLLLAAGVSGCGGDVPTGAPEGKVRQFEGEMRMVAADDTRLFVIDAGADATAAELRAQFARELTEVYAEVSSLHDDAAWSPIRRVAVLAFPSDEGTVLLGPETQPDLEYIDNATTRAGLARWASAVSQQITNAPVNPGKNRILATLEASLALLSGARPPASPEERALLAHTAPTRSLLLTLISSHEDESPGEPRDYAAAAATPLGHYADVLYTEVVLPGEQSACANPSTCLATSRFEAWKSASNGVRPVIWRSPASDSRLIEPFIDDAFPTCVPEPHRLPNGQDACVVYLEAEASIPCDAELGLVDTLEVGARCEVRQLEGQALEACRTDPACDGCIPGFCFTETEGAHECRTRGKTALPRIVTGRGAFLPDIAFRFVCNSDEG